MAAESDITAANLISFAYGNHFKVGLGMIWYDGRPENEKYEVFEVFVHVQLVFFEI